MVTFLVLLLAYVLSQFFRAFLAIVAADLGRDLGFDAPRLGEASAVWFAAFAVAQIPVGLALDRFGPRRTMAVFMLAAVAGAALFAAATSAAMVLFAMALIGIGCSPVLMASLYVFGRTAPPHRFALLASAMIGFGSAGNLAGAAPLALAVEAFGWRASMAGIAAMTLVSTVLVYAALRDPPPVPMPATGDHPLRGFVSVARIRALWPMLPLVTISYAVVIAVRGLWIAPYFGEVHGFGSVARGNAALLMAIAMTVGALAYGPLERLLGGPRPTTIAGSLLAAAALIGLGITREPVVALCWVALLGAAGMTYGMLMSHGRLFLPANLLGRGVTFLNFLFIGGAGLLQYGSGQLVGAGLAAGLPPGVVYGQLFTAFGVALLVATAVYLRAPARPGP
ncbi:MAG: MFS transporter [Alsobacter sp.]